MEENLAIQVHGLQKSYGELQVLNGVDFDVTRGSIFALLGANGSGKTTIVRILTTLLKPDDGRRLDIAMSLIGNPQVIFLDEPTTGLDPEGRIEAWQVIQNLADSGTTGRQSVHLVRPGGENGAPRGAPFRLPSEA